MREYKHLAGLKRAGTALTTAQSARLTELEEFVKTARKNKKANQNTADILPASALTPVSTPVVSQRTAQATPPPSRPPKKHKVESATVDLPDDKPGFEWSNVTGFFRRILTDPKWAFICVTLLVTAAFATSFAFGASFDPLITPIGISAGVGWLVLYPAVLAGFEYAARSSQEHINKADFEAKLAVPEPLLFALVFLCACVWLLVAGVANAGIGVTIGSMLMVAFLLLAAGLGASIVVRSLAWKKVSIRAYGQYMEGAQHHLGKKNHRRARRLFERAIEVAPGEPELNKAQDGVKQSVAMEAQTLESRGLHSQAQALRERRTGSHVAAAPRANSGSGSAPRARARAQTPAPSSAVLPEASPPKVLSAERIQLLQPGVKPVTHEAYDQALEYERRKRPREALELLVQTGLPASGKLLSDAAQEYIGSSVLRSAFSIYEVLGEKQIPEFYKAVAVEITRSDDGIDAGFAAKCMEALVSVGEQETAARLGAQASLTAIPEDGRKALAERSVELCRSLGRDVPPELWEAMGRVLSAAKGYEKDKRPEDAVRCYKKAADELLAGGDPEHLIPVLSRLFAQDDSMEDTYLKPLVEHVIDNELSGPNVARVLSTYRKRNPQDARVSLRLVNVLVEGGDAHAALQELAHVATLTQATPDAVVADYRALAERFPEHGGVIQGMARALLRAGHPNDAATAVSKYLRNPAAKRDIDKAKELVEAVREWGHRDPAFSLRLAQLHLERGERDEALACAANYYDEGGANVAGADLAETLLSRELILENGLPNHAAHLQLARFALYANRTETAARLLEVARSSETERDESEILLGRMSMLAANPAEAVAVLRASIDGRHPSKTPELHYELARAYEFLGEPGQARKIDAALEHLIPGFADEYAAKRPKFDRSDTVMQAPSFEEPDSYEEPTQAVDSSLDALADFGDAHLVQSAATVDAMDPAESGKDLAQVLAPRYALIKRIGSGGMGDVHLAEDEALGREVAVKVLRRTLATDLFLAKFREEARTVAKLSHPGIVAVYDIGQEGSWSYIVMEYVRGPNLATLIHSSIPPSNGELVGYVAQVAQAMSYAHERNVIHRDLKPANILVGHDGIVKVTDFGIARVLQAQESEETAFSAAGLQVGTVNYMAPEQIRDGRIDVRTDIYLLATTLFFALSHEYPFNGDNVVLEKMRDDPRSVRELKPDISNELDFCLQRALARDPEDRYASMTEFQEALLSMPERLQAT